MNRNKKNQPRVNGKFSKKADKISITPISDEDFIRKVQNDLWSGMNDLESIKKAYKLITGIDEANLLLMRRTILSYSNN